MIVVIIPAKGDSSRLPNKNMILLNDKPLINYTIDYANNSKLIDRIYISTDSDYIDTYCSNLGLNVIRRPKSLGGDTPIIDVYKHAIKNIEDGEKVKILVGLQPDHPDRNEPLDKIIQLFNENCLDRLMSKDKDGLKNGAHYMLSKSYLLTGVSKKDYTIVDDCTNIHFEEDLQRAFLRQS